MTNRVAIIGAGVSGLTCGVVLAEAGFETTILAAEFGGDTTSAAAAAIWFPYDAGDDSTVIKWSLSTREVFLQLVSKPETGVSMIEMRCFARSGEIAIPDWAAELGARLLPASELPNCFSSGFAMDVPLMNTGPYLRYLEERFTRAGGTIRKGVHFARIEDVAREFDPIVNCAGIGARTLVPDDALEPHRGQVALVPKMDLPHAIVCDDPPLLYAIPRAQDCVFGGTNDVSDNRQIDPKQTAKIVAECSRVLDIAEPPILTERVGLRPFRAGGVCLRAELLRDGRTVIHNYGHGGAGFTLSWGCAREILALAHGGNKEGRSPGRPF